MVLSPDPFDSCPSDSSYGLLAGPARSKIGRSELQDADPGETVTLSGRGNWSTTRAQDFLVPFEFVSGEQHLRQEWELQLVKIQCGVFGCDDDRARFRGPPERIERKMKRAVERAKELRDLKPSLKVFATYGGARARQAVGGPVGRGGRITLGLVCGHRERGKHREVAGAFLKPRRRDFEAVTYAGAREEARVTCLRAPGFKP
jgi:hypothetical protein